MVKLYKYEVISNGMANVISEYIKKNLDTSSIKIAGDNIVSDVFVINRKEQLIPVLNNLILLKC